MLKKLISLVLALPALFSVSAQEAYDRPLNVLSPETRNAAVALTPLALEEPIEEGTTFHSVPATSIAPFAAKDYSLSITVPACANDNKIPLTLNIGKDVKGVRYLCIEGDYANSDANFDLVAQYGDEIGADEDDLGSKALQLTMELELTTERSSRFTILIVTLDKAEKGTRQQQVKAYFYSINDDDSNWKTLGNTYYVEDIVSNMYSSINNTSNYVSIQEHRSIPGYYRLVNPYGTGWSYKYKNRYSHSHKHYIYIHAEDPNRVYLDESPICVDFGHGGVAVASMATPGFTSGSLTAYYGKMQDHVITFPSKSLLISMQDYNSGKWYKTNSNAMFRVTVPPSPQTLSWDQTFPTAYVGDVITLYATASSGLDVEYSLVGESSSLASLSGNRLTLLAPGTITVKASQPGDNKVWAAAASLSRQIVCLPPDGQSISWNQDFPMAFVGDEITLTATATSGLPVSFTVDPECTSLATISGDRLTLLAPGTVTVIATQDGNNMWAAAEPISRDVVCTSYTPHDLFVMGPFSDWAADEKYMFTSDNSFLYTAKLPTNSLSDNDQPVEWCIANANSTIRFGKGNDVTLGGSRLVCGGGNNISNISDAVTIILFLDDECWTDGAMVDMTILPDDSLEGIIPETLGVVGEVDGAEWNLENFPMLHKEGNVFTGSVTMTGPNFILCEHGMTEPDNFYTLGTFYGPHEETTSMPLATPTTFVPGNSEKPFTIEDENVIYPKRMNFSVDFDTKKVTVNADSDVSFIDEAVSDDEEPMYYNLQGMRISRPLRGIYIEVRGTTATKRHRNSD